MGLGYNGVSRLDRLGKNRKSTLVSLDKVVVLKWDELEQKKNSMVGTTEDLALYGWIRMVGRIVV